MLGMRADRLWCASTTRPRSACREGVVRSEFLHLAGTERWLTTSSQREWSITSLRGLPHLRSSSPSRYGPITARTSTDDRAEGETLNWPEGGTREGEQGSTVIPPTSPNSGKATQSIRGSAHMGTSGRMPSSRPEPPRGEV
jgi:hypothetical protein